MLFPKKIRRVLNVKKSEEKEFTEELEKGDIPAMLIAAFLVFTPVILVLIGIVWGLYWLFTH
jgi:bifunctional DNA-binding transcriptional regulator/antitoxin component of YhaV-PrlF toxin-antitoxin module